MKTIKYFLDFLVAIVLLILLLPVIVIVAILVRINLGSPVLFSQKRPGLNEKIFKIYKFRTMTNECDSNGVLLPANQRLTKFGAFLRKTSLDELPQLVNVLKLELSLVGPRPLLVEYLPLYSAEQSLRHTVKPGITGWAQINGRNSISWKEKFELDVWYVRNWSLLLDFKILFRTALKIVKKDKTEINFKGNDIEYPFDGTN